MGAGVGGWNQLSGPTNLAALQCVVNATPSHSCGIEVYRAEFSQMDLGAGAEEWKRFQAGRQSKYKHLVTNHRMEASATADFPGKDRLSQITLEKFQSKPQMGFSRSITSGLLRKGNNPSLLSQCWLKS